MIVKNPTNDEISVQLEGNVYILPAMGEIHVPTVHAEFWKKHIHNFLELEPEAKTSVAPKKEEVEVTEATEVAVEPEDEVVEEAELTDPTPTVVPPVKPVTKK